MLVVLNWNGNGANLSLCKTLASLSKELLLSSERTISASLYNFLVNRFFFFFFIHALI